MLKKSFVLSRGVINIGIVLLVLAVLVTFVFYALMYVDETARKATCACSLREIGSAMLVYAGENKGLFPMVSMDNGLIVGEDQALVNVKKNAKEDPFMDIPSDAGRSVSMNLWLLCRNNFAQPEIFLCSSDPRNISEGQKYIKDGNMFSQALAFCNFSWAKPGMTISYSFSQPWSETNNWDANAKLGTVIGADANNGEQPNYVGDGLPLSDRELKKYVNSRNHGGQSQNVLHIDCSVSCESSPYVGLNQDNIYTAMPDAYTGKPGETAGVLNVRPRDKADAVLIPNIGADLANWNCKP